MNFLNTPIKIIPCIYFSINYPKFKEVFSFVVGKLSINASITIKTGILSLDKLKVLLLLLFWIWNRLNILLLCCWARESMNIQFIWSPQEIQPSIKCTTLVVFWPNIRYKCSKKAKSSITSSLLSWNNPISDRKWTDLWPRPIF